MDFNELERRVQFAIDKFYARDSKLLELGGSERPIAHRIAVYMETLFEDWNVDCEYNRGGQQADIHKENYERPDIIIHHRTRKELDHNLLTMELKIKNSDNTGNHDTNDNTGCDQCKLKRFTSSPNNERIFQYQYGLALSFKDNSNKDNLEKKWFKGGKKFDPNP
jgi:hypothetical protein